MRRGWGLILALVIVFWALWCTGCLYLGLKGELPNQEEESVVVEVPEEAVVAKSATVEEEPKKEKLEAKLEKLRQIENATLTHYCICRSCCGKDESHPAYGITASGREAEPYVSVAVDPFLIPLGSKIYIDYGDGTLHEYRADDTGCKVVGARIDLCVTSHQEAIELGKKTVRVYWEED